ncbi:MAG: hypothetical protein ABL997_01475 [Planctomycetota bacterium]
MVLAAGLVAACSVSNLTYGMVVRDLDSAVVVDGSGQDQRLVYKTEVEATAGIARWSLLLPLRPLLLGIFGERVDRELENPSSYVRELIGILSEKAGTNLLRCADSAQRLVRVAELDPAPLNRVVALDGIARMAKVLSVDLLVGVKERGLRLDAPIDGAKALDRFTALRPAQRVPVGAPLSIEDREAYVAAIEALTLRALPHWSQRLALIADLSNAVRDEQQSDLRSVANDGLRSALAHALQWAVLEAAAGRNPEWIEVRLRALEELHRSGGPDSVPLLLAILAASPDQIAAGEPMFEDNDALRLRLVHLCGQLDPDRAVELCVLPGREAWQRIAPAEYLVRMALDGDPYYSSVAMPAREAIAHCLRREHARPAEDLDWGGEDWIRVWFAEFQKEKGKK